MKKFNKILIVGPKHVHVENGINLIRSCFNTVVLVAEEETNYSDVDNSYEINFRSKNPFTLLRKIKELQRVIKKESPDVIQLHSANRVGFALSLALRKINIPLVTTTWGSDVLLVPKKNLVSKKMVQFILNKSDYITADSQDMVAVIRKLSNTKQIREVLFGIDPIGNSKKEKIIYSNRLHNPLYNISEIIDLFHKFQANNPEWKLVVGAIGKETENLKQQVGQLKISHKVEFVGWLDKEKNRENYQRAHIYISIPSSDGTAVSLLEAMSAGCVPVVSGLKVSKEWIENNKNGILYNGGEDVLEKALSLNQEKVAKINQEIINTKATKDIATQNFFTIFEEVIPL